MLLWCAASGLQSAFDQDPLSEVSVAGATANVEVWVGLRALLGLYPGYGLNQAEELRRQAYAVPAALAVTSVFALAFEVGDLLSRLLLVSGFLGLLLLAPLLRHFVKRGMMRIGLWPSKKSIFLSAKRLVLPARIARTELPTPRACAAAPPPRRPTPSGGPP